MSAPLDTIGLADRIHDIRTRVSLARIAVAGFHADAVREEEERWGIDGVLTDVIDQLTRLADEIHPRQAAGEAS